MSTAMSSRINMHLRGDPAKPTQPATSRPHYSPSINLDSIDLSRGLQGSGKYTDNAFRTSLRNAIYSPNAFRQINNSKEYFPQPKMNKCLSARTMKTVLSSCNEKNRSSRTDLGLSSISGIAKSKENISIKTGSPPPISILDPKLNTKRHYQSVLKESNRELTTSKSVRHLKKNTFAPCQSSLSTEQDSLGLESPSAYIDINEKLRNIFKAGVEYYNDEQLSDFSVAEEQAKASYGFQTKPYVTSKIQIKLKKKF